jgi:hypothetical protein
MSRRLHLIIFECDFTTAALTFAHNSSSAAFGAPVGFVRAFLTTKQQDHRSQREISMQGI